MVLCYATPNILTIFETEDLTLIQTETLYIRSLQTSMSYATLTCYFIFLSFLILCFNRISLKEHNQIPISSVGKYYHCRVRNFSWNPIFTIKQLMHWFDDKEQSSQSGPYWFKSYHIYTKKKSQSKLVPRVALLAIFLQASILLLV